MLLIRKDLVEVMTMEKIIDISHHNTVKDWNAVKASVDGVIIRMGYRGYSAGTLAYDRKFADHKQAVELLGIPHSFYFFPCSIDEKEANEEADFIINALQGATLSFPVFLDSEIAEVKRGSGRSDKLSRELRTKLLAIICERLQAAGIPAGVYSSTAWFKSYLDVSKLPYSIWVAQWSKKLTFTGDWVLWQYTDKAEVPGIAGRVDMSRAKEESSNHAGGQHITTSDAVIENYPFKVGTVYHLRCNLYIRSTPGGQQMTMKQLTENARAHAYIDGKGYAILKNGTAVTCKGIEKTSSGSVWMKIPSGYVCGIASDGRVYIG